jgi:hypothetical protein
LEKASENLAFCPAITFIVIMVGCSKHNSKNFPGHIHAAKSAPFEIFIIRAEGVAVALGKLDGAILAPFGFKSVVEEARTLT